jgi:dipeptidyl aminopeptidase/acylaminoacyl peptidase
VPVIRRRDKSRGQTQSLQRQKEIDDKLKEETPREALEKLNALDDNEVDKTRIAFHGVSWGAYWGTKMAVVEHDRLKAVSVQSPPTDLFFTRKFLTESLLGNREYLFDQVPALMAIFDNVNTVDDIANMFEKMSLARQGILGKVPNTTR